MRGDLPSAVKKVIEDELEEIKQLEEEIRDHFDTIDEKQALIRSKLDDVDSLMEEYDE